MSSTCTKRGLVAFFALLVCSASAAAAQETVEERMRARRPQGTQWRVTLIEKQGAAAMPSEDFLRALTVVTVQVADPNEKTPVGSVAGGETTTTSHSEHGPTFNLNLVRRGKDGTTVEWTPLRPAEHPLEGETLVARLKELLAQAPDVPPAERAAKLEQLRRDRASVRSKQTMLSTLVRGRAEARTTGLNARLGRYDAERETLEIDLAAARARADALREHIHRLQVEAERNAQQDPIREQLERVVQARREEVKRVKQLASAGHGSEQEVGAAEGRVAEAEIHLLTRREQVMRGNEQGELLGRLANELAMISIDEAEKEARLRYILKRLPQLDPHALDEKALEAIAKEFPSLAEDHSELPPLYYELEKRQAELLKSELALCVSDVKLEPVAVTAPAP